MKRRILVTGGFGFIGGHLLERLVVDPNNQVQVVDNLATSPLPLDVFLSETGAEDRIEYLVRDAEEYCRGYDDGPLDEIYHLASFVGPAGVLQHAGAIAVAIVSQLDAVADLAERSGAKLIFVSTSEVYGGGQDGYCSEDMPKIVPCQPSARLEYALGKLAAETALLNRCHVHGLPACIIRPFNVSGPRQSGQGGFVLPRFIGQAIGRRNITVFGDGTQRRAFTHVADIVDGLILTMEKGAAGEVYNLGNPDNQCSILELAEDVVALTETSSAITFIDPKTIYGPQYREANDKFPDATKALSELGWAPSRSRRDTIRDTYAYMANLPVAILDQLQGA